MYRINEPVNKFRGRKYFFFGLFAVVLGIASFITYKPSNSAVLSSSNEVSATSSEDTVSIEETQRKKQAELAQHPLAKVSLPKKVHAAIGTAALGPIKSSPDETQVPIASITKIITALVILDKSPLELNETGDTIILTAQDEQYYYDYLALQGTLTGVTAGLSMSQYEALQAMLLASSNNMSDTIVDRYFSSKQAYLDYANQFLRDNGLLYTQVADTTGFSPDSKSTPSDLIKLGQLALANPVIREIVAQPSATIAVGGEIPNYNPLVADPDIIGLKPGATDEAGYTLLFAAELPKADGETEVFIGVILGFEDRAEYVQTARNIIQDARAALTE